MLAAVIILAVLVFFLVLGLLFIFIKKPHQSINDLKPEDFQDLNKINQNLEKLPILDTKIENISQNLTSQSSFLPKMETKIDILEQKTATETSLNLLKENLNYLQKITTDLEKKAKIIETKTDSNAYAEQQKLQEVTNNLGKITSIDENIASHLNVAMSQTKIIPTLDTKVDTIKQHTSDINAIKSMINNLNQQVIDLNKLTIDLSTTSKNTGEENLRQLMLVQQEINDLNKIFINDRNRGSVGENILEDFLSNYFGPQGEKENRLWATQYKVTNINKKNQEIGLVDAVIFTPNQNKKIAIDAKFPLKVYLAIFDEKGNELPEHKKEFINNIKNKIKDLKKYIHPDNQIDSVIMFLPSENIYYFIANKCPEILHEAYKQNIWLAGPTILMAILHSQHQVILDYHLSRNINKIKNIIISLKSEFERFDERATSLKDVYDRFVKSADLEFKKIEITQNKIYSKIERLESLDNDRNMNNEIFIEPQISSQIQDANKA